MSFIVKIILLGLSFSLSAPAVDKTQYFVHSSVNSAFQLINGIEYFNSTAIVTFFKVLFASIAPVFSNNLVLYFEISYFIF